MTVTMSKSPSPATNEQKRVIIDLFEQRQTPVGPAINWPEPFSEDDANHIIEILKEQVKLVHTISGRNHYA